MRVMLFSNIVCAVLLALLVEDFPPVNAIRSSRLMHPEESNGLEFYEPERDLEADFKEFLRSLYRKQVNKRELRNLVG
ncbi:unnamed protein product [Hymenolepis diminuta]|uniref:Uncharacterized protein n=1 Tax=Hymenolepis diminuta TaxID=6216 RepID=A0A564Z6I3_HYMDI|nr:unnamed protein product [Hymenolepis diminuta]